MLKAWIVVAVMSGQPHVAGQFESKEACEHAVAAIELAVQMGKGLLTGPRCYQLAK